MIIDSAINNFFEKYDREAMETIDELSKEFGLNVNDHKILVFNMKESFQLFNEYINGYADYKIKNINNDNASPQYIIRETVDKFITENIFKEVSIKYNELPDFIQSYINGIKSLNETVNNLKHKMIENDVDAECIGDVNDFCDAFMIKLHESFDPCMDRILWASGYNFRKRLVKPSDNIPVKPQSPIFL